MPSLAFVNVYPFKHIHTDNLVEILKQYWFLNIDGTIKLEIEQN